MRNNSNPATLPKPSSLASTNDQLVRADRRAWPTVLSLGETMPTSEGETGTLHQRAALTSGCVDKSEMQERDRNGLSREGIPATALSSAGGLILPACADRAATYV